MTDALVPPLLNSNQDTSSWNPSPTIIGQCPVGKGNIVRTSKVHTTPVRIGGPPPPLRYVAQCECCGLAYNPHHRRFQNT